VAVFCFPFCTCDFFILLKTLPCWRTYETIFVPKKEFVIGFIFSMNAEAIPLNFYFPQRVQLPNF